MIYFDDFYITVQQWPVAAIHRPVFQFTYRYLQVVLEMCEIFFTKMFFVSFSFL